MSPGGWLLLGLAVVLAGVPGPAPVRTGALAGAGRLAPPPPGRPAVISRRVPWPRLVVAAAVVGVGLLTWSTGPLLGLTAAGAGATAGVLIRDAAIRRLGQRRRAQLRTGLGVLIGELVAGSRPPVALAAAARAAPDHAAVLDSAAVAAAGTGDAGAILAGTPATAAIGAAWRLAEQTGAGLVAVLSRLAEDVAAAEQQRRTVAVALAGPRSSSALLTGLPAVGLALGTAMGARPASFLVGSGAGRAVCCLGVLLDAAGVLWIRRILRRAEQP